MEKCVSCKHGLLVAIFHEPANAVLRVAWCVKGRDFDRANVEGLAVVGRPRHILAFLTTDNLDIAVFLDAIELGDGQSHSSSTSNGPRKNPLPSLCYHLHDPSDYFRRVSNSPRFQLRYRAMTN